MSKKTQNAYEWDKLMFALVGETCSFASEENTKTLEDYAREYEDYKASLDEINAMILHASDLGDASEVASWRRMLMRTKMEMRELKAKMMGANNIQKEYTYS